MISRTHISLPARGIPSLLVMALVFAAASSFVPTSRAGDKETVSASHSSSILSDSEKEDLGDVRPDDNSFLSHFHPGVDLRGDYTTNALLHGNHGSADFLFLPTVSLAIDAPITKSLGFNLIARSGEAIYSDHGDRSFWGFSGLATFDYRPIQNGGPHLFAGVEPYWNTRFDGGGFIDAAYGLTTGIDQGFVFGHGKNLLTAGYSFTSYFSDPSQDNRDTHRVLVALTHEFKRDLFGQLFYQYSYDDFTGQDRHDSRNAAGFNLIYQFTRNIFGNFTTAFVDNHSSNSLAQYQSVDIGASLTLQY